jgi:hypothetical protein
MALLQLTLSDRSRSRSGSGRRQSDVNVWYMEDFRMSTETEDAEQRSEAVIGYVFAVLWGFVVGIGFAIVAL